MEIVHNNATLSRPGGDRIIDAPTLFVDLPAYVQQIKGEEAWEKNDRNSITVFKTDDMRIVLCAIHKNGEMLPHRAEADMALQVLEGTLKVNTDEQKCVLGKGQMMAIHKGCNYHVIAAEESLYLLTLGNVHE
jgi:quercetin dioxygenase-like cupin family protein